MRLLDHYGLRSTRINRSKSHENGVAEHAHYRLKDAIDQALILRGSRDFNTTDDYAGFVRQMVERCFAYVPCPQPRCRNTSTTSPRW